MRFGDFFKQKRLAREATLRQFCLKHEYDPGNISKLERCIMAPPQSKEKLDEYAKALGLKKSSEDYVKFCDLAFEEGRTHQIQASVRNISDKKLLEKIPLLFRTLDNSSLTEEKLNRIIELARAASTP